MNTINTDLQTYSQPYDLFAFSTVNKAAQETQVTATSLQQKDITVYTREGDKVTLSLEARAQLDYSSYQGQVNQVSAVGAPNAAALESKQLDVRQETLALTGARSFTITVEGDLSDQELKDIKTAIQQIDTVMMDVLGRAPTQATAEGLVFSDLDTLAGLEARYYQAGNVAVQQTTYRESEFTAVRQSPPEGPALDGQDPAPAAAARHRLEHLIDTSRVKPKHLVRPLKGYFNHLSKQFYDLKPFDPRSFNMARRIGNDLIKHVSAHA